MGCVYNIIICTVYTYLSKHKYNKKTCYNENNVPPAQLQKTPLSRNMLY